MFRKKLPITQPLVREPQSDDLALWLPGQCARTQGTLLEDCSGKGNNFTRVGTNFLSSPCGSNVLNFDGVDDYCKQEVLATKVGTVTASMVAENAFINDFSQKFDRFASLAGGRKRHMIVATDSASKNAMGYLEEEGADDSGALGVEMNVAADATSDPNGTEANSTSGWTQVGSPTTFESTDQGTPNEGSYHLHVVTATYSEGMSKSYATITGRSYAITFDTKIVTAGKTLTCRAYNSTSGTVLGEVVINPSDYTSSSLTVTAIDSAIVLLFRSTNSGASEFYVDNISFKALLNGETLGADLFDAGAGTFDSGTGTWTAYGTNTMENDAGALKVTYVDNENGAWAALRASGELSADLVVGALYKLTFDMKVNTGTVILSLWTGTGGTAVTTSTTSTGYVKKTIYFTANSATGVTIAMTSSMGAGEIVWLDNLVLKQVLTPNHTSGIKIFSTRDGSTQSWAVQETGFKANAISSYEIRKTDFQITGAIMAGAWVKGASQSNTIMGKYNAGGATALERAYKIGSNSDKLRIYLSSGGTALHKDYSSSITAFDNTWHSVAFFFDGNDHLYLFVDGQLDPNPTTTVNLPNLTTLFDSYRPLLIGADYQDGVLTRYFAGQIDQEFIRAIPASLISFAPSMIMDWYNNTRHIYGK